MLFLFAGVGSLWALGTGERARTGSGERHNVKAISVGIFDRGEIASEEGTMEQNRWTRLINDRAPSDIRIDFRAYPRREALQEWDTEFAAGTAPDLVSTYWGVWLQQKAFSGHAKAVGGLLDDYAPAYLDYAGREFLQKYGKVAGRIHLLPSKRNHTAQDVMWVRSDWLANLDMDPPDTQAEFREMVRAFTEGDPDGNGKDDTYGISLNYRIVDIIFAAHGIKYGNVVTPYNLLDGEVVLAHEMPGFWEAVRFMRGLFEEGYVHPDFVQTGYDKKVPRLVYGGTLGLFARNVDWGDELLKNTRAHDPGAEWSVLPIFESENHGHHPYPETFEASLTGIVNSSTAYPAAVVRYVNMQAKAENRRLLTYGIEGRHYRLVDGIPIEINRDLNSREQHYARRSSYFIIRADGISSAHEARRWSELAADRLLREAYDLQAEALERLDEPYEFSRNILPMYLSEPSTYHSDLRRALETTVQRAIIGGDAYTVPQARRDLREAMRRFHYAEVKSALNSGRR